jgi:hypothetical protein
MNETLPIDFADRADVRAKLPEARHILEEKAETLRAANDEYQDWAGYVEMLEQRAGTRDSGVPNTTPPVAKPAAPAVRDDQAPKPAEAPTDLVVEVVDRENRKIRAQDVWAILRDEGHELAKVAVSNALFYAAKRAKPPRLKQADGRGLYAPLNYQENPFLEGADLRGVDLAEIFTGDGDA